MIYYRKNILKNLFKYNQILKQKFSTKNNNLSNLSKEWLNKYSDIDMKIIFLGTNSGPPSSFRGAPSLLLSLCRENYYGYNNKKRGRENWLFDCGEATSLKLNNLSAPGLNIVDFTNIFITHMHGDHIFGLSSFILTWHVTQLGKLGNDKDNIKPLNIYGPEGLYNFIVTNLRLTDSMIRVPINIIELKYPTNSKLNNITKNYIQNDILRSYELPISDKYIEKFLIKKSLYCDDEGIWNINDLDYIIKVKEIRHRIRTFGYIIEEKNHRPNIIEMKKAIDDGILAGPLLGYLKYGIDLLENNGNLIKSSKYLKMKSKTRKITILGDTNDSSNIKELAKDSNILIHECTLLSHQYKEKIKRGHSRGIDAANFAKECNIDLLALTHFGRGIQNYKDLNKILWETKKIIPDKKIIIAEDYLTLPIPEDGFNDL